MKKACLVALISLQLSFSGNFAFAQAASTGNCGQFYSGSTASSVCAPANSAFGNVNDPWGTGTSSSSSDSGNVWNNGGVTGGDWNSTNASAGWDPSTSNTGYMGGYGSSGGIFSSLAQATPILNENYPAYIAKLRADNAYAKTDDELAQIIINEGVKNAAISAAGVALGYATLQYIYPRVTSGLANLGGLTMYMGFDWAATFVPEAKMILRLAALYYQLPPSPVERYDLITTTVMTAVVGNGAAALGQNAFSKYLASLLNYQTAVLAGQALAPAAIVVSDGVLQNFATSTVGDLVNVMVKGGIQQALITDDLRTQAVNTVLADATATFAKTEIQKHAPWTTWLREALQNNLAVYLSNDSKMALSAGISGAIFTSLSWATVHAHAKSIGNETKIRFETMANAEREAARRTIETSNYYSKQTLWQIVLRYIFNTYPTTVTTPAARQALDKERQKVLQALSISFPLVKNEILDERADILADFDKDLLASKTQSATVVRLVDHSLTEMAAHLNFFSRLYFMKTIIAAMYQGKHTLTAQDQKAIETISYELGLSLPAINKNKLQGNDPRLQDIATFDSMLAQMADTYSKMDDILKGKVKVSKDSAMFKNLGTWGKGGTIILEDKVKGTPYEQIGQAAVDGETSTTLTGSKNSAAASAAAAKVGADPTKMCVYLGTCNPNGSPLTPENAVVMAPPAQQAGSAPAASPASGAASGPDFHW